MYILPEVVAANDDDAPPALRCRLCANTSKARTRATAPPAEAAMYVSGFKLSFLFAVEQNEKEDDAGQGICRTC